MTNNIVMFEQWQTLTKGQPIICDGETTTVDWVAVYPSGTHQSSCVRDDWQAVGVHTPRGTRWVGREEPEYRRSLGTSDYADANHVETLATGYAWGWKDSHPHIPALMSTDFGVAYRLTFIRHRTGEFVTMPAIPEAWDRFREHGTIMWR
jgi:hypothetical protein